MKITHSARSLHPTLLPPSRERWSCAEMYWTQYGGLFYYYYSCLLGNPISLSSGEWPNAQSVLPFVHALLF